MSNLDTWREMISWEKARNLDDTELVAIAPGESVLDIEFDGDYGSTNGPNFLAWSETHVYFPVRYDGAEFVGSAPRNPTSEGQRHVGG